jgi:hypothetical protein
MHMLEVIPKNLTLGDPVAVHGLGIIPIISENTSEIPKLDLLEPALKGSRLKITEISEEGTIPFVRAENIGSNTLLILNGEELVVGGRKRILSTSVIILPQSVLDIPASCMAVAYRHEKPEDFTFGDAVFRTKSLFVNEPGVSTNLMSQNAQARGIASRQLDFWLAATHARYPDFRASRAIASCIESLVDEIPLADYQIGTIFLSHRGIFGLALMASLNLFQRCFPKILRRFAFETLLHDESQTVCCGLAEKWWDEVRKASFSKRPSCGAGEDLHVETGNFLGSGLFWKDTLIDFSCFPGNGLIGRSGD